MKTKLLLIISLLVSANFMFAQSIKTDTVKHYESDSLSKSNKLFAYADVEIKPVFPGGDTALLKFIAHNTKYPETFQEQSIQGRVFVQFIIDKEGKVTKPEIMRGVDPYYDAEALRVASIIPDWIPGKQNGVTVPVSYIIPVTFKIY